jgi:hypothetical protein
VHSGRPTSGRCQGQSSGSICHHIQRAQWIRTVTNRELHRAVLHYCTAACVQANSLHWHPDCPYRRKDALMCLWLQLCWCGTRGLLAGSLGPSSVGAPLSLLNGM